MRKHDVRKWLHAALDLLPVILIPVFMIYSHRHDVAQDFDVVTPTPVYYASNDVSSSSDLVLGNAYEWLDNNSFTSSEPIDTFGIDISDDIYYTFFPSYTRLDSDSFIIQTYSSGVRLKLYHNGIWQINAFLNDIEFPFLLTSILNLNNANNLISSIGYYGNYFKEYVDVSTTLPKDVMTSFMDRFNNTINEYFNMGNVFNLSGVYDWFNTNIFSGHAPTVIYSVWNIALYELVMDLLFLLYGLFMWFIDIVQNIMDKPFKSIK